MVTVIIPARPDGPTPPSVAGARGLDWPADRLEVIVVRGRHPAVQRNAGLAAASGDWIYFLDDDAMPDPANLQRARRWLLAEVVGGGGPALEAEGISSLQRVFAAVMANTLATGPSASRYRVNGALHPASEKELIGCNLILRRDAVEKAGGFPKLYPNEENVLLDRVREAGGGLMYDPGVVVRRPPRRTVRTFVLMVFRYGIGRGVQLRRHPGVGSLANLLPAVFVLWPAFVLLAPPLGWAAVPYLAAVIWGVGGRAAEGMGVVVVHHAYGAGVWWGLTRGVALADPGTSVALERH